jgi:hypothetical protein
MFLDLFPRVAGHTTTDLRIMKVREQPANPSEAPSDFAGNKKASFVGAFGVSDCP